MALILAVNPGNAHNPTLSRLARELQGCEIIGADSCAVAIKAIKKRVPDVLLLPARARGEADLRAHLRRIPGGVPTLTLPPIETADPLALAGQIRELLIGMPSPLSRPTQPAQPARPKAPARPARPVPPTPPTHPTRPTHPKPPTYPQASPELRAAASAAASWIHARRRQWSEPLPPYDFEPDATYVPHEPHAPHEPEFYEPIGEAYEPDESRDPHAPYDPHETHATYATHDPYAPHPSRVRGLLPRAAAIAAVLGVAGAAAWYLTRNGNGTSETARPAETTPPAIAGQPAATPPPEIEATIAAPPPQPVTVVSPFEVSITEAGQPVPLDGQGRAMLLPGKHRLRFQNNERGYDETRMVQVRLAEPTILTLSPETAISVTSNEPAEVLIDGTRVGETPYEGKIRFGSHTVTVKTSGAERQLPVTAASTPIQLEVDFSKP